MLPRIPLPNELQQFITDVSESAANERTRQRAASGKPFHKLVKSHNAAKYQQRAHINHELKCRGKELLQASEI